MMFLLDLRLHDQTIRRQGPRDLQGLQSQKPMPPGLILQVRELLRWDSEGSQKRVWFDQPHQTGAYAEYLVRVMGGLGPG